MSAELGVPSVTRCGGNTGGHRVALGLHLRPITRSEARLFVARFHRHNKPPSVCVFQVAAERNGEIVGVALAGIPRARMLDDGRTLEIIRVATDGTKNVCSMLYGACCRAGAALGYQRAVTYTLASESGASLRASGFGDMEELKPRDFTGWGNRGGARSQAVNLFGERSTPDEPKRRWWRQL